jgi:hypothetical protein
LHIVDINEFKIVNQLKLKDSDLINDISRTGEQGIYALAQDNGLVIVKSIR